MNDLFKKPIERIIDFLVSRKYKEVVDLTRGVRLSADEMRQAISDYGRILIPLPENAFDHMQIREVRNANPPEWAISIPLWTKEEGLSDLTLELTIIRSAGNYDVEVDDIHVL